ncbi:MAG TPA: transposase [Tepidisphaeraceae bacterium]|jgi:REP element-mobilizing transposase RayT
MVLAYHVIFTAYGFWLPNDPRGSWSDFVRSWELLKFGPATKVSTRRSLAHDAHDAAFRAAAKRALRYPPVRFDGLQARAIARGFAKAVERTGCIIYACSIMPDHVHMVIARHRYDVEQLVGLLKGDATRRLQAEGLHPMSRYASKAMSLPTPWVRNCWKVFLDHRAGIDRAIGYVERNPLKEGMRPQRWNLISTRK